MKDEWNERGLTGDLTEPHSYYHLQYKEGNIWKYWSNVPEGHFDKFWESFERSYPNTPKRALKTTYEVTKYEAA